MKLSDKQKKFCLIVAAFAALLFVASSIVQWVGTEETEEEFTETSTIAVVTLPDPVWEDDFPNGQSPDYVPIEGAPADLELVHVISNDRKGMQIVLDDLKALRWENMENELIVVAKELSSGRINLYAKPDASGARVGEMLPHAAGRADSRVEDETGDWYHVISGEVEGYARAAFFVSGADAYALLNEAQTFWFNDEEQNERALISMTVASPVDDHYFENVPTETAGATITIQSTGNGQTVEVPQNFFASIRTETHAGPQQQPIWTGNSGSGGGGRPTAPPAGVAWNSYESASAERKALVDKALTYVGGRYVWGGNDPATGVDCSGFVKALYGMIGIELPRYSRAQAELNTRIALKDMQAGDLVFYARDGAVYHVAMYIGDGKIVHARSEHYGIVVDYLMGIEYRAVSLLP